jgi:FtsH-binding integral membrane protein
MITHLPGGTPGEAVDAIRARAAARTRQLVARGHVLPAGPPPGEALAQQKEQDMDESVTYPGIGAGPRQGDGITRSQAHTLFAVTMGYVAITAALFALGAYLGRNLSGAVGIIAFVVAFGVLIGMRFAAARSQELAVALLALFGLLIGLAVAPTVSYYASMDPQALWYAGGATALFILAFGTAGWATRRDLTALARVLTWALLALIVAGIVLIFVHIPGGALVYSILGLVIFAGFVMFDFQRLRHTQDIRQAPLLAASIFLDILNVFLFFLEIFSGQDR